MNKKSKKMKGFPKRLLALMLCCFCLLGAMQISAVASEAGEAQTTEESTSEQQTESSTESEPAETSETVVTQPTQPAESTDGTEEPSESTEPDQISPADALFERLMAAATYEELDAMMEAMTEEEYTLMGQFTDEQNVALQAHISSLSENAAVILADNLTIQQGESGTTTLGNASNYNYQVRQGDRTVNDSGITVSGSNNTVTITVDETTEEGTYTIRYRSGSSGPCTELCTVEVTAAVLEGKIKVYVYVASEDSSGNSWLNNEEFKELIGLTVCDNNGYFPAGVIELDASYLNGKTGYNTPGAALINSQDDWTALLSALSNMDTSTLNGTDGIKEDSGTNFSENQDNHVSKYLSQASKDINQIWGSQKSALFRWGDGTDSLGFDDQSVKYHLDLCFNTKKITFITGNNGITSGSAKDGTEVDDRVYITGSIIQPPRNLTIPDGYKFMGYYEDANFTIPWDGIGTPLNEDQTVYIKITPMDNVIVHYVVAEGEGSVSLDNEAFNPQTGKPVGSTATASADWAFDGWYADEDCTQLLSKDEAYVPTAPNGGWQEGAEYTYYAKFVPATTTITLDKVVTGNMGDRNKDFTFTVKVNNETFGTYKLNHNTPVVTVVAVPVGSTVTITESDNSGYVVSATVDGAAATVTDSTITIDNVAVAGHVVVFTNNKDITIDTGILLDTLPYILILGVVAVGAVLLVKRRRNCADD